MTPEFTGFPKIARLSRECIISEKIDGTNAQVFITPGHADDPSAIAAWFDEATRTDMVMFAGSRTRWITLEQDNHGFARWATENAEELVKLGEGRHFGEWWGSGIQRGYGLSKGEKRFSLFNSIRWVEDHGDGIRGPLGIISQPDPTLPPKMQEYAPTCCHVVPVLYRGDFDSGEAELALNLLRNHGSKAAPGFMNPEGIVVFHTAGNVGFKRTLDNDGVPKTLVR